MGLVKPKHFVYHRNVNVISALTTIAGLLADQSRARMVEKLLDGEAKTATELALHAGISAQTASAHLAKLTSVALLECKTEGRCRYYRLAGPGVAEAFEALTVLVPRTKKTDGEAEDREDLWPIRLARTCYDHLAGRVGVAVTNAMVRRRHLVPGRRDFRLTRPGETFLSELGVDVERARRQRRVFARQCVDWTERRPHLAGALGAALATRSFELDWLARVPDHRHLVITAKGRSGLARVFRLKPALWLPTPSGVPSI